jgi:hypothetical protein
MSLRMSRVLQLELALEYALHRCRLRGDCTGAKISTIGLDLNSGTDVDPMCSISPVAIDLSLEGTPWVSEKSTLIVFGGLPGTGKTTFARASRKSTRRHICASTRSSKRCYLPGILQATTWVRWAGYPVAYEVAESNLLVGLMVVADSVNPLAVTRDAWRQVAATTSSEIVEIKVVCSDITDKDTSRGANFGGSQIAR